MPPCQVQTGTGLCWACLYLSRLLRLPLWVRRVPELLTARLNPPLAYSILASKVSVCSNKSPVLLNLAIWKCCIILCLTNALSMFKLNYYLSFLDSIHSILWSRNETEIESEDMVIQPKRDTGNSFKIELWNILFCFLVYISNCNVFTEAGLSKQLTHRSSKRQGGIWSSFLVCCCSSTFSDTHD